MLSHCCPRSWMLCWQSQGQGAPRAVAGCVSWPPLLLLLQTKVLPPERSLTLFPCDMMMGCDMVFVGLLLIFCSPLTQQAWPLQCCVAQSPFISTLLFALPGARRRHLEIDTGGTTSVKYLP